MFAACTTSIAAAIAAIATHYTDKSNGEFGCTTSEMRTTAGKVNTNFLCSREMGACNFAATYQKGTSKAWSSTLACNEVVSLKLGHLRKCLRSTDERSGCCQVATDCAHLQRAVRHGDVRSSGAVKEEDEVDAVWQGAVPNPRP